MVYLFDLIIRQRLLRRLAFTCVCSTTASLIIDRVTVPANCRVPREATHLRGPLVA